MAKRKLLGFQREKVRGSGPPEGMGWYWISWELQESVAWRSRSVHCIRLIDFLLREHMSSAGRANGELAAPYDQLRKFGIGSRYIPLAIKEACRLGLVEVRRGGVRGCKKAALSRYRLTFYASLEHDEVNNVPYYVAADDKWRRVTKEQINALRHEIHRDLQQARV